MNVLVLASLVLTAPGPELVDVRAVDGVCASDFATERSDVRVYRDDDGDVTALELVARADGPTVYFSDGGRERLVVVDHQPPGSVEAEALLSAIADALDGGVAAELLSCRVEARQIHELEGAKPGRYLIEGYVADIYNCGLCPARAMCKACDRAHIALSETKRTDAGLWPLGKTEVLALTANLLPLRGVRYRLRVAVTSAPPLTKHSIPDVEVLALTAARR